MQKNYILDTNVLIHDPRSLFQFEDNNLYVPIYVLEELDKLKGEPSLRGRNSREACRILDELRCKGNLRDGVPLENGGSIQIYIPQHRPRLPVALDPKSMDHAILQSALEVKENSSNRTILVTMDVNLRVRSEALGMQTAAYENDAVDTDTLNNRTLTIEVSVENLDNFYKNGTLKIDKDIPINSSIILKSPTGTGIARSVIDTGTLVARKLNLPPTVMGLKPRNVEQKFALDLLLDDTVKFITLMGIAGSGKSILALSAALYSIFEIGLYTKLLIARPVIPMGNDIGFLPGSVEEKLRPYMQPIYDNVEYLLMACGKKKYGITSCEDLFNNNTIEIEPLVYIRGRSIINQIVLIDEAQGLSQHEMKTIISRCGENTKIIFTGDIEQIDNPYISKETSGMSVVVTKINNNPLVGHLRLEKGERSELANLAVTCL
jgi:PhoH-like ATPase